MKGFLALCKCLVPAAFGVEKFHLEDFGCLLKGVNHIWRIGKHTCRRRFGGKGRTALATRAAQASFGYGGPDRKMSFG